MRLTRWLFPCLLGAEGWGWGDTDKVLLPGAWNLLLSLQFDPTGYRPTQFSVPGGEDLWVTESRVCGLVPTERLCVPRTSPDDSVGAASRRGPGERVTCFCVSVPGAGTWPSALTRRPAHREGLPPSEARPGPSQQQAATGHRRNGLCGTRKHRFAH